VRGGLAPVITERREPGVQRRGAPDLVPGARGKPRASAEPAISTVRVLYTPPPVPWRPSLPSNRVPSMVSGTPDWMAPAAFPVLCRKIDPRIDTGPVPSATMAGATAPPWPFTTTSIEVSAIPAVPWIADPFAPLLRPPSRVSPWKVTAPVTLIRPNSGAFVARLMVVIAEPGLRAMGRRLGLTRRQAEVLSWIAQGKSNAATAVLPGISERTVAKHLENIFTKLGVESRLAAALLLATPP
jgi:DNA-binding CsgD family transcriptional regulator